MFDFLNRGRSKVDRSDHGPSTMPQTVQTNSTQRDMARLTLHHILKHHGIPAHWIAGELIPIHIPGQGEASLLQLEIMHWHDDLVPHAPALQQELLAGLHRFEAATGETRYLFTWKFSPDCGCPHTQLPDPAFWGTAPEKSAAPAPSISAPLDHGDVDGENDDQGFAPTQIHEESDLRP